MTDGCSELLRIYHLTDNWESIKSNFISGMYMGFPEYPYKLIWFNYPDNHDVSKSKMLVATIEFKQRFGSYGETLGNFDVVIKSGNAKSIPSPFDRAFEDSPELTDKKTYIGSLCMKDYKLIDTQLADEYFYYSFLSSIIFKIRLSASLSPEMQSDVFDYDFDSYTYIFLTGEEANAINLSDDKREKVKPKLEEAKKFLRDLHKAVINPLKQTFKERYHERTN